MVSAIFSFLCSILISLGGSVTADNIGQDFATIYSNQDPSVQRKIDEYFYGNPGWQLEQDLFFQGTKLTTEMLYNIQNGNVSNQVIQESVGIEGWKNFLETNQSNVLEGSAPGVRQFCLDNGRIIEIYAHQIVGTALDGRYDFYFRIFDKDGNVIFDGLPYHIRRGWSYIEKSDAERALSYFTLTDEGILTTYKADGTIMEVVDISNLFGENYNGYLAAAPDGSIGSVGDASDSSVGEYPIAPDGSITLPDGTKVYPNSNGTYTINNNTYSPVYNISSYNDAALLALLAQILEKINEIDSQLEFEQEGDTTVDEELEEAEDEALEKVESAEGVLSKYTYSSKKWTTIFPFCIPWDFVRGVKLLSAAPVAPRFSIPFEIPSFGQFPGYKTQIVLNFSDYEQYFVPVRWFTTTLFLIGLGFITYKIVKGAA
ncbi:MAG: hypothetical protein ACI4J0_06275 [Huintestinicola sp.]|uniref:hypothetical protein n=1 Tax=Huintestinicola sp. TaxID=2981661 RepID=UPI003F098DF0